MNPQESNPKAESGEVIEALRQEIRILRRALELALPGYLEAAGRESRRLTA